jgi:hypothetical protein
MRLPRPGTAWSFALLLLLAPTLRAAAAPPDPLQLLPGQAELVVAVERPRGLVESVTTLDLLKEGLRLEAVREATDIAPVRRFYRLVAYYEKELGATWPELLDQVAGRGVALAVKFGPDGQNQATLAVVATDPRQLDRFVKLVERVAEEELARQEAKERPVKATYRGVETLQVGKDFHAAVAGPVLLLASTSDALHAAIDRQQGDAKAGPSLADAAGPKAARGLQKGALAWLWFDLARARQVPGVKDALAKPSNDPGQAVLFGGWIDIVRRADFVSAGLYREADGFRLSVRLPVGRDGMTPELGLHLPPAGQPGSLPPLEPKGVLFSSTFYLDLSKTWEEREKLFTAKNAKALEEFDKNGSRFLVGTSVSKLLKQAGPYHRVVVSQPSQPAYKIEPGVKAPAFAYVTSMRDPAFGKSVEAMVRAAGLFALGAQLKLKMVEEKHGDVTLVGYRFAEDAPFPGNGDPSNIRYNFTPCFATVGDQVFIASTMDLGRELIDLLKKTPDPSAGSPATTRMRFYASGGAAAFEASGDQLLTQTILDRAATIAEAKKQIAEGLAYLRKLGVVELTADYGPATFRFDIHWQLGK